MSVRNPSSQAILIGGVLFVAAGCVGEEVAPPIPWQQIETWAMSGTTRPTETPQEPGKEAVTPPAATDTATPSPETAAPATSTRTLPIWNERYAQLTTAMGNRLLRATQTNQLKQLYEIHYLMEQYDKAVLYLLAMLKDTRRWADEDTSGWTAARLWEAALLQGGTANPDLLKKCYEEWQTKERERLRLQATTISLNSLKKQEESFAAHQLYFNECKNIAELIKQKERDGETEPAALWEMCDRFEAGRPSVPIVHIRFLYKLREWYPDFPKVKSGLVQYTLARVLGSDRLRMYKEAAEEMEQLPEKWPESTYVTTGGQWAYAAATYWMNHGDQLKDTRDKKGAREAWRRAQDMAYKLKKDYPTSSYCHKNTLGRSDLDNLLGRILGESRLGSSIGK